MSGANSEMRGWGLWEVALITGLALGFRLLHLEELRHLDSYFHIMAAASWVSEGTLSLGGERPYDRAYLFTYLVAAFQSLFGGTTFVAGLPSVLAGAAWVTALFLWVRSVAGRVAAWVAGLLFCFDVGSLALAHMVRFYTLHGLVFFLGAIGLYYLITRRPPIRVAAVTGLAVLAAFSLAFHLQYTTVIGGIALGVWLIIEIFPNIFHYLRDHRAIGFALVAPGLIIGSVAGFLFLQSDMAAEHWHRFRSVPAWAEENRYKFWFYISPLERTFPLLWALFPLAAVIAVARYGRPAIFSIVLFAVPLILHSLAAFKATRYLSYAMPFYFAIGGFAVAAVLPELKAVARKAVLNMGGIHLPDRIVSSVTVSLLTLLFVAVALTSRPNWWSAYTFIAHNERPFSVGSGHWDKATTWLEPVIDSVDVIATSGGLPTAYYYLKRVHVMAGVVPPGEEEFVAVSERMGIPLISEPQSVETLVRCHSSGLVLLDVLTFRGAWTFNEAMVEVLQARAQPLALPEEWGIRAYTWSHGEDVGKEADCPVLEARRAPRL